MYAYTYVHMDFQETSCCCFIVQLVNSIVSATQLLSIVAAEVTSLLHDTGGQTSLM